MHIPDGFLDTKTAISAALLSAAGIGVALRRTETEMPRQKVPLMGLTSAFVFAAQMLNFPVAAGTSGHLIGGVLTAVLLGPWPAVIVMTSVLVLQCLLFADGGLLALGANVFNMAVVVPIAGYAIYSGSRKFLRGEPGRLAAVAFASWCSTVLASICCAGELAWSGTSPWSATFPAMANIHMLIGLGEAAISSLIVSSIMRIRPTLLEEDGIGKGWEGFVLGGSIVTIGILLFVAPFASRWPDGLEKVASTVGFDQQAVVSAPTLGPASVGTIWAALIGTIAVFVLSLFFARLLTRKSKPRLS